MAFTITKQPFRHPHQFLPHSDAVIAYRIVRLLFPITLNMSYATIRMYLRVVLSVQSPSPSASRWLFNFCTAAHPLPDSPIDHYNRLLHTRRCAYTVIVLWLISLGEDVFPTNTRSSEKHRRRVLRAHHCGGGGDVMASAAAAVVVHVVANHKRKPHHRRQRSFAVVSVSYVRVPRQTSILI